MFCLQTEVSVWDVTWLPHPEPGEYMNDDNHDNDDMIITCRWASCTASRTPSPSRSPPPPPTHSPGSPSTSLQVTGGSQGVFWSRVCLMSVFANESSYERWRRAEWEMLTQGFECSRSSPSQGRSSIFCDLVICLLTVKLNSYWLRSI